jgi:diaminohydroxyphosphoribosylaminopyrimidine deaminase/5-amino-6-(5-phosphoribosylamino)uracil reductase
VGAGTVLADDPQLTVRLPRGARRRASEGEGSAAPSPLRVVLDGRLRTPAAARVLGRGAPTLIVTGKAAPAARARALQAAGAEVLRLPGRARPPLARVLAELAARDVQSVLVEGGAEVLGSFIEARLVDRIALFVAPTLLGGGIPIATGAGLSVAQALHLGSLTARHFGDDLLLMADVVEN